MATALNYAALPAISNARLPAVYEGAKRATANVRVLRSASNGPTGPSRSRTQNGRATKRHSRCATASRRARSGDATSCFNSFSMQVLARTSNLGTAPPLSPRKPPPSRLDPMSQRGERPAFPL